MTMKPRKTGAKKSTSKHAVKKKAAVRKPAAEAGAGEGIAKPATLPSVGSIGETITARATRGVRGKDITVFLRQLIMMLEAGTPVVKALKSLSQRGEHQAVRTLVSGITEHVEAGNPLWQAFGREKKYFPPVFVNLIRASEASGTLTTVLNRLVTYREEREMMEKRIQGALMYPVVLLVVCFAVVVIIAKVVIPEFVSMFETFDIPLNAYTQGFISASSFVGAFWWLFVVAAVATVTGVTLATGLYCATIIRAVVVFWYILFGIPAMIWLGHRKRLGIETGNGATKGKGALRTAGVPLNQQVPDP